MLKKQSTIPIEKLEIGFAYIDPFKQFVKIESPASNNSDGTVSFDLGIFDPLDPNFKKRLGKTCGFFNKNQSGEIIFDRCLEVTL